MRQTAAEAGRAAALIDLPDGGAADFLVKLVDDLTAVDFFKKVQVGLHIIRLPQHVGGSGGN